MAKLARSPPTRHSVSAELTPYLGRVGLIGVEGSETFFLVARVACG